MSLSIQEIGYLILVLFIILMLLKMPIAVAMIVAAFLGIILIRGLAAALPTLAQVTWRQGLNEVLMVIPLFTWMGLLASAGGISKDAFASLYKWVGHFRGGLAMAVTCACAAFGAVCGNQIATAATMCKAALPEMRKYKYDDGFSLGCISAAGNLGIMIPPSGAFVIYGFVTETSIGSLFLAGIIPGLLITVMFCTQIYIQCLANSWLGPPGPNVSWLERLKSIKGLWSIIAVFILVMGGIYMGIFTPTEGAACGTFAVLLVSIAGRQLTWKAFVHSLRETIIISSMIMLMIFGAMLFSSFITITEIPKVLTKVITMFSINPWIIMAGVLVIYMIAGFIMDIYAILIVTLPIFFPILISLGFDPLHFGVLSVLTIMMGSISPPFGIVVFAIGGMNRDVPMFKIFGGAFPFLITMLIGLVILLFIPVLSTWIPDMAIPYR